MTLTQFPATTFHHRHNTMPRYLAPTRPYGPASRDRLHLLQARTPDRPGPDRARLLVDLTSPWAYLAHLRLDRSPDRTGDTGDGAAPGTASAATLLQWHVFQPSTARPVVGLRLPGPERERVREDLEAVRAAALEGEEIPDDLPAVLPHPRAVAAAYAEGVDLGRGREVRAALLHAYWVEGRDIGDPEVLRRILPAVLVEDGALCTGDPRREWGYVVTPAREPLSDSAYHLLARWQQEWDDAGRPGPLALVGDGAPRVGADALALPPR